VFVLGAILIADEAVARGLRPLPTYAGAIVLGAHAGSFVGVELRGALGLNYGIDSFALHGVPPRLAWLRRFDVALVVTIVASLGAFAHVSRRNAEAARKRQLEAEAARARAQRRTLESELQARVEPGFLFATLERISRLYGSDTAAAGAMLEDLIAYLRAALPHLRESASTVRQELALASARLDIMRRSTPSLEVAIGAGADVKDARLPALVMLPLVQRALADAGVEPVRMVVSVVRRDDRLRVTIETGTRAFGGASAGGLASLAERLDALYGPGLRSMQGSDRPAAAPRSRFRSKSRPKACRQPGRHPETSEPSVRPVKALDPGSSFAWPQAPRRRWPTSSRCRPPATERPCSPGPRSRPRSRRQA
jgi:hypothetical protein